MMKNYFLSIACILMLMNLSLSAEMMWEQATGPTSCFSSARAADLNNDGVKDFVIGGGIESNYDGEGNIIQYHSDHMVMAIDGATGDFLWQVEGMDQIFASPIFLDVTGDGIPEVFIGGRNGFLLCINGATGVTIWQFFEGSGNGEDASEVGLYNFYTAQWIPDQNDNGLPDLLVSNGGDRRLPSWETDRPAGKLMVIDPVDGELLASAEMPDGKETYMSPLVYDFFRDGKLDVIFGTGGEAIGGSLFRASLAHLMAGDLSGATTLLNRPNKGFIAPPSLADLTGDNIPELITNTYDGHIIATDGWTNEVLWDYTVEGAETNASPAIGLFNEDDVPDVFTSFLIGVAPTYSNAVQLVIDGATGELQYENTLGSIQYSSPVIYDMDSDGIDEAIMMINVVEGGTFYHDILACNFVSNTETSLLGGPVGGTNIASTPWIGKADEDGLLDLFYVHNADETSFISEDGIMFKRHTLEAVDSNAVAWGAYMGSDGDGFYDNPKGTCFQSLWNPVSNAISPTCIGGTDGEAQVDSNGCPCMFNDCVYTWSNGDTTKHAFELPAGDHYLTIIHEDGCVMVKRVTVEDPPPPLLEVTHNICSGENLGTANVVDINDSTTYISYLWSTGATTPSVEGLSGGTYTVEVVSPVGCTDVLEFVIEEPNATIIEASSVNNISCNGLGDGTANWTITGGAPPYLLTLNGTDEYVFESEASLIGLESGNYGYNIEDANGCNIESGTINIVEPEVFDKVTEIQNISCEGETGSITVTVSGGTAPYYYISWTGETSEPTNETTFTFDGLEAGLYEIDFRDANECNTMVALVVDQVETFLQGNTSLQPIQCAGETGSVQLNIVGGTPPYQYIWNGETSEGTEETTFLFENLAADTYSIELLDANGCNFILEADLMDVPVLDAAVSIQNASTQLTSDGSIDIIVSGGTFPYTYDFNEAGEESSEDGIITLEDYPAGTYTFDLTDANGCTYSVDLTIEAETIDTNLDELSNEQVKIYPNPNRGEFMLEVGQFDEEFGVFVYNAIGQNVSFEKVVNQQGKMNVKLLDFETGVYFVSIEGTQSRILHKIVVF